MMPRASRSLRMRSASAKLRASARRAARLDQLLDLLDRHRRPLVLRAGAAPARRAPGRSARTCRATARRHRSRQLAGVDRRVQRAHQIEHHAERRRRCSGRRRCARAKAVARLAPAACAIAGVARRRAGSVSSRARKSVSRLSASSACAIAVHENFSCLR